MEMHPNQIKAINEKIAAQRRTAFVLSLENPFLPRIVSQMYELSSDPTDIRFDKPLERDCDLCIVAIADHQPAATFLERAPAGASAVTVSRPRYL